MILRLVLPTLDGPVEWVKVGRWDKRAGDFVTYGDVICDLSVQEIVRQGHQFHPKLFEKIMEADGLFLPEFRYTFDRLEYRMRLVSSDQGWLRAIAAPEGNARRVGDLLALLATEPDETTPSPADLTPETPTFRAVANLLDDSGGEGAVIDRPAGEAVHDDKRGQLDPPFAAMPEGDLRSE